MKTLMVRIAFASILALCFAVASAQPAQRGNQSNRQQQRAGAVTQAVLDAMAAQADPLQLIFRKDVQHDLECDLGQRNKFDNLHDRQAADLLALRRQGRRNQSAVADLQAKQKKEVQDKMDELLTAGQKARLKQIVLQLQGGTILLTAEMQKQLGISDEQSQRLKQIQYQHDTQLKEAQDSVARGETRPQDLPAQIAQIQKDTATAIQDVLTPEQLDQYQKMLGKPFKPG
jgi:hypothetical protein